METSTALAIFVGLCVLVGIVGAILRPDLLGGEYNDSPFFDDEDDPIFGVNYSGIKGNIYHINYDDDFPHFNKG